MYAGFVQQTKTVNSDRRSPALLCWSSSYGAEGRNTMVRTTASRKCKACYFHISVTRSCDNKLYTLLSLYSTGLVRWEWRLRTGKFSLFIRYVFMWLPSSVYSVACVISSVNYVHTLLDLFQSFACRVWVWGCHTFRLNTTFLSLQPNRTYYLEDPTGQAQDWVDIINKWLAMKESHQ